ncbi:MAG: putative toxin-antitoxin system toxin component, PIN family [Acidobacteriaceae bacterium]
MRNRQRIVIDTNVLMSALLLPHAAPAKAVRKALESGLLLISEATMNELADVLARPKFDRYISLPDRKQFLRALSLPAEFVPVVHAVRACRDPKNDKFLELACNGSAHLIISGDQDLLYMHPFRNISILSPAAYLAVDETGF